MSGMNDVPMQDVSAETMLPVPAPWCKPPLAFPESSPVPMHVQTGWCRPQVRPWAGTLGLDRYAPSGGYVSIRDRLQARAIQEARLHEWRHGLARRRRDVDLILHPNAIVNPDYSLTMIREEGAQQVRDTRRLRRQQSPQVIAVPGASSPNPLRRLGSSRWAAAAVLALGVVSVAIAFL
jgi:hypothetical protein